MLDKPVPAMHPGSTQKRDAIRSSVGRPAPGTILVALAAPPDALA
jgi:hypothetical protein